MIFRPATEVDNPTEKNVFIEQTKVYVRLVEVFCEMNGLTIAEGNIEDFTEECKLIGVVRSDSDIDALKALLGKDYTRFFDTVCFARAHKEQISPRLDNLYNSARKQKQEESLKVHNLTLVDFFCGAGGLSLGFIQEGFNVKLANDIEDVCIETYRYNHPELPTSKLIQGDIKQIVDNIEDYISDEIDVVVGGPPCQGFSEANRQRIIDDPRNKLYKYFVEAVKRILPKIVVMENVKGMLKVANQVVEDYERINVSKGGKEYTYTVSYKVLNSQDFSVAQSREILIYIAVRNDITEKTGVRPCDVFSLIEQSCKGNKTYILDDALADIKPLDAPRIKNTNEIDSDTTGKKIDANYDCSHENEYLSLINEGRRVEYLFNHKARYVNDINYEIYRRLNPGDDATDEKIKDIMPYAHRNHCFKDKYYKLQGDRPCRTITAHLRMDCHSHIHPRQIRALTPREAARVQSFPDDYLFLGAYLKTYMQIGNAVPPMMARGIARVIRSVLEGDSE